jgi:hypothetical protein
MRLGLILAVLVGISAAKSITDKRIEFFREAASGYDVAAYYLAVNIVATIWHLFQFFLAAVFAFWLRLSLASWKAFYAQLLAMAWLTVSWALLLAIVIPKENVVLTVGFFMAFMGVILSGASDNLRLGGKLSRLTVLCRGIGRDTSANIISCCRYL